MDVLCRFFYNCDQYPSQNQKELLAATTGLPCSNVQNWFQNRRAKEKRENESQKQEYMEKYCTNQPLKIQGKF